MKRTKTCKWCEWHARGWCRYYPEAITKYSSSRRCGIGFQWNEEAMNEMVKESEAAVKEQLDYSSKGKG